MKSKTKKIIKYVITALTAIISALILYMLVCNVIAVREEKPVNYFGYSYSYVPTKSMEPTIKAGDTIIFKKVSYKSLKVGDIIVYKSQSGETKGMYIIHRIISGDQETGFTMKGDNNSSEDPEIVTEDMLIGKYTKTFNFLNLGKLASNKNVIYGLLILFFLGIMVMEGVNIVLTNKKNNSPKAKSKDELREEMLKEMKEELLKEIQDENKDKENEK